ncbi:hypothetical protein ABZP36_028187 [Zizania latifolia]
MIAGGGGGGGSVAGASPYMLQSQHGVDGMDAAAFMGVGGEQQLAAVADTRCHALLYNLSVLKDRVQQLHPLVGLAVARDGHGPFDVSAADAIIQEIVAAASSMMYAFQLLCDTTTTSSAPQEGSVAVVGAGHGAKNNHGEHMAITDDDHHLMQQQWQQNDMSLQHGGGAHYGSGGGGSHVVFRSETAADTIIELDAAELLAKYTHYCQVCGKGFKRDANLRMHMRAHGDEYKSNAALSNPSKAKGEEAEAAAGMAAPARKYSCPQEGCRWNRRHAKFQPLKSVICAKNHYKRSHCPKMYVCNRCGRKHFSVLSDLRTHEKHCGDHRWLCNCGTSFSRKDKLAGHVALFVGHQPLLPLDGPRGNRRSSSAAAAATAGINGAVP